MLNGLRAWWRDSEFTATACEADGHEKLPGLLAKGVSRDAINDALVRAAEWDRAASVRLLLAQEPDEAARGRALSKAVSDRVTLHYNDGTPCLSDRHFSAEVINMLLDSGIGDRDLKAAVGKAVACGNEQALETIFTRLEQTLAGEPGKLRGVFERATADVQRSNMTLGVERLLAARNLLPSAPGVG